MSYVMALTKTGDEPDQEPWQIVQSGDDPRDRGIEIGNVIHLDDEPDTHKWRVEDIFVAEPPFA